MCYVPAYSNGLKDGVSMVLTRLTGKVDSKHVALVTGKQATKPKPRRKKKPQHYVLVLDKPESASLEDIAAVAQLIFKHS